jgi:hypothetical protein
MGVVEAKIQTVEDIYHLIWLAVANKQPVRAIYKERPRLFCPPADWAAIRRANVAFCVTNTVEKARAVWRR